MGAPKWSVGMLKLGPGTYADGKGALHISAEELCEFFRVPYTKHNADLVREAAIEAVQQSFPNTKVVKVDEVEE